MSRPKKLFLIVAAIFFILLVYASYDISRRTTFPGSKPQLNERLKRDYFAPDSLKGDSIRVKNVED